MHDHFPRGSSDPYKSVVLQEGFHLVHLVTQAPVLAFKFDDVVAIDSDGKFDLYEVVPESFFLRMKTLFRPL